MVFYDNNRKKWGEILCGIPIINLDELMNLLKEKTSTIIVATKQVSGLYFLKDVCTSCLIFSKQRDKSDRFPNETSETIKNNE